MEHKNEEITVKTSNSHSKPDGDDPFQIGNIIQSKQHHYKILNVIGQGTFGRVLKCSVDNDCRKLVAIKILMAKYSKQINQEIKMLGHLKEHNAHNFNIVLIIESFDHINRSEKFIVLELLGISLYNYTKNAHFKPLELKYVRRIIEQILTGLIKLKELKIIHADLKPENVMIVDQTFRIKIIDFGASFFTSEARTAAYIQSRFYRSPEVIVGAPYDEAIDVWSTGCIAAELFSGWPLYPGRSESHQIQLIVDSQGTPPKEMLDAGQETTKYFFKNPHDNLWRLQKLKNEELVIGPKASEEKKRLLLQHLRKTQNYQSGEQYLNKPFFDFLEELLALNSDCRIRPDEALAHPFITLDEQEEALDLVLPSVKRKRFCKLQN